MLADVVGYLICPHCDGRLDLADEVARCPSGHSFDLARQGYLSLLSGGARAGSGDTADMVDARTRFLDGGHFDPIVARLGEEAQRLVADTAPGCVLDVGAGPGHQLAAVLDRLPQRVGIAADVSKHAARRAARAHPRIGSVVCDAWRRLPVHTGGAALVLDVFAPRNGGEIARVLHPNGALIVVSPTGAHLAELVEVLGLLTVDPRKEQRLEQSLAPGLVREAGARLDHPMSLSHAAVSALVGMGPTARHATAEELGRRIAELPEPVPVTASVTVGVYRPRY